MPGDLSVELHTAFFWICDACGSDNFHRGIAAEAPPGDQGEWVMQPDRVKCDKCGAEFDVEEPAETGDG